MKFEGFVGPTYALSSLAADAQRAINLYPEIDESGTGKNKLIFRATPGLTLFTTLPTAPVRGLWAGGERLFAAAGTKLYEVFAGGTYTDKGAIANDSDNSPAQIFPNGNQLFVVASGNAYLHDGVNLTRPQWANGSGTVNTNLTAVTWVSGTQFDSSMAGNPFTINSVAYTVASVQGPTALTLTGSAGVQSGVPYSATKPVAARTGAFLDSYFIAAPYGKQFYISALNDGLIWDALDYSTKEGYPDNIASVLADHEELWLLGDETTEGWRNEGGADFPFRRDPGAFMPKGIIAPWSAVKLVYGPAWLGGDTRGRAIAYRAQGFQPVRISTHAVEQAWGAYSKVSDAIGYAYEDQGHTFWVLTFPTGNATWVYDLTTNMWHERAWWNGASLERHRGRCHAFVFDKHLVGDHATGKIYQMSSTVNEDDGVDIHRVRTAPHLADEDLRISHHRFALDLDDPAGNHNLATLDWSDNGGSTYVAARGASTSSALSGKLRRMVWRRLGSARDRVYRVTFTQRAALALINAYLDLGRGTS